MNSCMLAFEAALLWMGIAAVLQHRPGIALVFAIFTLLLEDMRCAK